MSYASDDDGSVISLQDSVRAISIFSDINPVKQKHEHLDKRLNKIERKLDKLRISKLRNKDIEMEWNRCKGEIFKDVDRRSPQSRLKVEKDAERRQEFLQRLSSPKRQRPKTVTDGIAKTYHAEIEHQAKEKPGIGDYVTTKSALDTRGGRFNMSNSKSEIEWRILEATKYPGSHIMLPTTLDLRGGRFNQSKKPLTERDWIEKRAKTIPGPGQYDTSLPWKPSGGRFNCAREHSNSTFSDASSVHSGSSISSIGKKTLKSKPDGPDSILVLPSTLEQFGGRFNQSKKPLTERDWIEKRAKTIPGPGHYNQDDKVVLSGGKFNTSQSKNDVEWKIYNSRHTPGPGGYNVADAMNSSSQHISAGGGGRFTMVYRPLEEDKRHLAKGGKAEYRAQKIRSKVQKYPFQRQREEREESSTLSSGSTALRNRTCRDSSLSKGALKEDSISMFSSLGSRSLQDMNSLNSILDDEEEQLQ